MLPSIESRIAAELAVRPVQVAAAVALIDEGATVPFIARYRKEATGGLDDTQLRTLSERLVYLRELEERQRAEWDPFAERLLDIHDVPDAERELGVDMVHYLPSKMEVVTDVIEALQRIEEQIARSETPQEARDQIAALDNLRSEMAKVSRKVPVHLQINVYQWRLHVAHVRSEAQERLWRLEQSAAADDGKLVDDEPQPRLSAEEAAGSQDSSSP